jgi:hypothetical protein
MYLSIVFTRNFPGNQAGLVQQRFELYGGRSADSLHQKVDE